MAFMRKWHRYLGIWTALLVLMLSITGILLVHKKELGLNRVMVSLPGSTSPADAEPWQMLAAGNRAVIATKQGIYIRMNETWLRTLPFTVRSIKKVDNRLYAATRQGLHESSDNGERWQQVLPAQDVRALDYSNNQLVAASTTAIFVNSGGSGQWTQLGAGFKKPLDVREVAQFDGEPWLVAKEGVFRLIDGKLQKQSLTLPAGMTEQVELQKIISDLHNGKLGGGVLITAIDLTAAGLIFLTVSGIWIWWVPRRKKLQKGLQT